MSNNYVLSCSSTTDLSAEKLRSRNLHYMTFKFRVDDVDYADDFGASLPFKDLYAKMGDGAKVSTTQITAQEYVDEFEPILKEGKDIVHITLSSGISGTYQSALSAKKELEEKYPERKVYIIDSLAASSGYGMLSLKAADYRDQGHTAEELVEYVENLKLKIHHVFFSTDLSAYIRGGRISAASGLIGTLLRICPLMYVNKEGKLIVKKKLIGKKRAEIELMKEMLANVQDGTDYDGECFLCHSECRDDAEYLVGEIEKTFPALKGKCEIYDIGATIGCHSGPGTAAVFFIGKERV